MPTSILPKLKSPFRANVASCREQRDNVIVNVGRWLFERDEQAFSYFLLSRHDTQPLVRVTAYFADRIPL